MRQTGCASLGRSDEPVRSPELNTVLSFWVIFYSGQRTTLTTPHHRECHHAARIFYPGADRHTRAGRIRAPRPSADWSHHRRRIRAAALRLGTESAAGNVAESVKAARRLAVFCKRPNSKTALSLRARLRCRAPGKKRFEPEQPGETKRHPGERTALRSRIVLAHAGRCNRKCLPGRGVVSGSVVRAHGVSRYVHRVT